jgi:hypothetical protein
MNRQAPCLYKLLWSVGLLASFALGPVAAAQGQATKARPKPLEEGFTRLVEGDSQDGWIGYGQDKWPEGWEVSKGVLHRVSSSGDLMTEKEYGDFDLRFGWKISPGGNSGVMYRVSQEKGPAYETGPEYQILDNARHADGKQKVTSAGSLYALYAPSQDAAKPAGEWNRGRIVVEGNRVRHFLNGKKVVDAQLGGDEWNKLVAESKFAAWPKFGKNKSGHIVLQDHGNEVWFRNLRIKEL